MILTYTYGDINRSFSGRLRLSVIFDYPANGNWLLARIIEVLLYLLEKDTVRKRIAEGVLTYTVDVTGLYYTIGK
jgi:hypothetical protein